MSQAFFTDFMRFCDMLRAWSWA